MEPTSLEAIREAVLDNAHVRVEGWNSKAHFRLPAEEAPRLSIRQFSGILEFSPQDQVLVVKGGTHLREMQEALLEHGQVLPFPDVWKAGPAAAGFPVSIGGALAANLPHAFEGQCGSWRDWVLGMKVMLADGQVAKSGSKAVKSVAGYDVHRLMIGARGTLGIILEVTLRTFPAHATPAMQLWEWRDRAAVENLWIQRTLPSDFPRAIEGAGDTVFQADLASSTLWASVEAHAELPRYPNDWVLRSNAGLANLILSDPAQMRFMRRAKEIFDPAHRFNPGEFGIF